MKLDRRWWVAIAAVVLVGVAAVLSETVFSGTSDECRPVVELLDFNKAQAQKISEQTNSEATVPTVADEAVYQQWADGLAQRAQNVTDPELAGSAVRVADLATQFVTKLPRLRAETEAATPGAPAPQVVHEMNLLNARISDEFAQLSAACPD
jgi:hypothetical protein